MSFQVDLNRFIKKANTTATAAMQKVVVLAYQGVQTRTPVDTGRARANWTLAPGSVDTTTTESTDVGAAAATAQAKASKLSLKDKNIYIANNLPYARRLEYGWSKQAPSGMVRVTAQAIKAKVDSGSL